MEARHYQLDAVDAVYKFLAERAVNPCVVLPTGAGKTLVIATICRDAVLRWDGRVLVVSHVKELLEQSAKQLQELCPTLKVGLYSAGLRRRETESPVIVAGVQSVYDKAVQLGHFDLVIVDEAHLIPLSGDGMYRQLIRSLTEANPDLRVIGFTATPYRTGSGMICSPEGILNEICYEIGVKQLIAEGYLCKLLSKAAESEVDTRNLDVVRGEFDEQQAERMFSESDIVRDACREIVAKSEGRHSVLIFCQSVGHARWIAAALRAAITEHDGRAVKELEPASFMFDLGHDPLSHWQLPIVADYLEENDNPVRYLREYLRFGQSQVGEIYGDAPAPERERLIRDFREQKLRFLVNVNVLTTGFDAPNVDVVCLLRATMSPGLFYQMVGRGFRLHESKQDCLILDFGENIKRHGPVDMVHKNASKPRPRSSSNETMGKTCPECREVVASRLQVCVCGYLFEVNTSLSHNSRSGEDDVISGQPKTEEYDVLAVKYSVHHKKGADASAPKTMRVDYQVGEILWMSEWVCVEHSGFARDKAEKWWGERCIYPCPKSALDAVVAAKHGLLAKPVTINVKTKPGERFPEVKKGTLDVRPVSPEPCPECGRLNFRCVTRDDGFASYSMICGGCGYRFGGSNHESAERYGCISTPENMPRGGMLPEEWGIDEWSVNLPESGPNLFSEYETIAIPDDCPF